MCFFVHVFVRPACAAWFGRGCNGGALRHVSCRAVCGRLYNKATSVDKDIVYNLRKRVMQGDLI